MNVNELTEQQIGVKLKLQVSNIFRYFDTYVGPQTITGNYSYKNQTFKDWPESLIYTKLRQVKWPISKATTY